MATTLSPHFRACADKAIQQALGKPWRCLARGPHSFDCWGFVLHVMSAAGIEAPDFAYSEGAQLRASLFSEGIATGVSEGWKRVPDKTPYSVVALGKQGIITHVAVYHPSGIYYHCMERQGVVGHTHNFLQGVFDTFQYWGR